MQGAGFGGKSGLHSSDVTQGKSEGEARGGDDVFAAALALVELERYAAEARR